MPSAEAASRQIATVLAPGDDDSVETMTQTSHPAPSFSVQTSETFISRAYSRLTGHQTSTGHRLILIMVLAVLVHVTVRFVGLLSEWLVSKAHAPNHTLDFFTQKPKFSTLVRLIANTATFVMYFFAFGFLLEEVGVNLTAYLASASIIGLAISFGSQGLVQDMVIGLTLIFSDALDVGDLVEIAGTAVVVGRVEEIGLRFTKLLNFFNQVVFIPNRTIANVSRFPQGGIHAYADVQIPPDLAPDQAAEQVRRVAQGMRVQFGAIILEEPEVGPVRSAAAGGWDFIRVTFKLWPGQGGLIETAFRQHMVRAMKTVQADYADWQVLVTYRAT